LSVFNTLVAFQGHVFAYFNDQGPDICASGSGGVHRTLRQQPNQTVQRTGASRFAQSENRTSSAAGGPFLHARAYSQQALYTLKTD
jgi:hypothetical protein